MFSFVLLLTVKAAHGIFFPKKPPTAWDAGMPQAVFLGVLVLVPRMLALVGFGVSRGYEPATCSADLPPPQPSAAPPEASPPPPPQQQQQTSAAQPRAGTGVPQQQFGEPIAAPAQRKPQQASGPVQTSTFRAISLSSVIAPAAVHLASSCIVVHSALHSALRRSGTSLAGAACHVLMPALPPAALRRSGVRPGPDRGLRPNRVERVLQPLR